MFQHYTSDSMIDCYLNGPILKPSFANINTEMLVVLQNTTVAIVEPFECAEQSIFVIA